MRTPEGWEKAEIDAYLEKIGAYVVKPATYGYGGSGHSDRVVCITGQFWVIEAKREGKEPTPIQWRRINECKAAGGEAAWGTAEKVIREIETWRQIRIKAFR